MTSYLKFNQYMELLSMVELDIEKLNQFIQFEKNTDTIKYLKNDLKNKKKLKVDLNKTIKEY